MYTESLAIFLHVLSPAPADVPPPPPPPPIVREVVDHGVSDITEPFEVGLPPEPDVIHEDDPRWDCTTMGNRRCGVTGPNGERMWVEYDETGTRAVGSGPVVVPDAPPDPSAPIVGVIPGVTEVPDGVVAVPLEPETWECIDQGGFTVGVNELGRQSGNWDSCWPIGNDGR